MNSSESFDAFLGGRFYAHQPKSGFRAGTDTILLAAAIPVKTGDRVLELGAGSGVGLMAVGIRVAGVSLFGIEMNGENVVRANRNLAHADLSGHVHEGDIFSSHAPILKDQFEHVFMNPPFYAANSHTHPRLYGKKLAHVIHQDLGEWVRMGLKRVRAKGTLTIIFPTQGLQSILSAIPKKSTVQILPIQTRENENARRIIVHVQTEKQEPLKLRNPCVLYNSLGEITDFGEAIARRAEAIIWS